MEKSKLLISIFFMCLLVSCNQNESPTYSNSEHSFNESTQSEQNPINEYEEQLKHLTESFIISNINDSFNENENKKYYKLVADHDDNYALIADNYLKLTLVDNNYQLIKEEYNEVSISLKTNEEVYLIAEQLDANDNEIYIEAYYLNNQIKLPYQTNFKDETVDVSYSNTTNILKEAKISYKGRDGGTYVYSNNPELFADNDLNTCLMKNENLNGEVYMAFEHANYSSNDRVYLGYKLINQEDHDVYITVENIGYQAGGTWFGQLAWYDFYNTKFTLPSDYLVNGVISSKYAGYDYAYKDYTPRIYTPTTYKLPAHESFFVIGGTSNSNYNNINVDNTANKPLGKIKCANGQVKFDVTQGKVTGMMLIYTDDNMISNDMDEVGYVTIRDGKNYSAQYQGIAHHKGVIDSHIKWEFNDNTSSRALPVAYTNKLATSTSFKSPYEAYDLIEKEHFGTNWVTHLNPQNGNNAVGSDIVEFICKTTDKKQVVIDNYHADGAGETANTANWMIEYQDHFTFVNRGNKVRKIKMKLKDHGTLATLLREKDGTVIENYYSVGLADQSFNEYIIEVLPQSYRQVVLDYLLVACSYGSVTHEVELN